MRRSLPHSLSRSRSPGCAAWAAEAISSHSLANGQTLCLDFREQAPHTASRDMFVDLPAGSSSGGWLAAATPGLVKGLAEAHRREGRLPWSRLLQPAIALAAEGHAVSYLRSQMLAGSAMLRRNAESSRILLRDGRYFQPGEILRQPELAATLERIAIHGGDEFYHGQTADLLTRASIANGGAIRLSDLDSFTCAEHQPLMYTYRGSRSLGDASIERWRNRPPADPRNVRRHLLSRRRSTVLRLSASSRRGHAPRLRRPRRHRRSLLHRYPQQTSSIPTVSLASAHPSILTTPRPAPPSARESHSKKTPARRTSPFSTPKETPPPSPFTINGRYGSGVTVPGLGFLLNNNMDNFAIRPGHPNLYGVVHGEANAIAAGKRPLSSMAPTIVSRNGKADLVLGTPGGPTIVSALAQVLLYILDFDWNPQDAVNAPRIHHQWLPDTLFLERGFPTDVTRALEARGHRLEYRTSLTDINAIAARDGWLEGGVDPRRESCAAGI